MKSGNKYLVTMVMILLLASSNTNAASYQVGTRLLGYNQIPVENSSYGSDVTPQGSDFSVNGSTVSTSLQGSKTFNGVDRNSDPASMTMAYDGKATVSAGGVIKTSVTATLLNGFYNPDENDPFVMDTSFNTDPNGVPEGFSFESTGAYRDTLFINANTEVDHIRVTLAIDGTLMGNGATAGVQIIQIQPNFSSLLSAGAFFDSIIEETSVVSDPINILEGEAEIGFQLSSSVSFDFFDDFFSHPERDNISGSADFFNTLFISEIAGFDENGNPVAILSATDSTGFAFNTATVVPVPTAVWMFGTGLIGLIGMARRKTI